MGNHYFLNLPLPPAGITSLTFLFPKNYSVITYIETHLYNLISSSAVVAKKTLTFNFSSVPKTEMFLWSRYLARDDNFPPFYSFSYFVWILF